MHHVSFKKDAYGNIVYRYGENGLSVILEILPEKHPEYRLKFVGYKPHGGLNNTPCLYIKDCIVKEDDNLAPVDVEYVSAFRIIPGNSLSMDKGHFESMWFLYNDGYVDPRMPVWSKFIAFPDKREKGPDGHIPVLNLDDCYWDSFFTLRLLDELAAKKGLY